MNSYLIAFVIGVPILVAAVAYGVKRGEKQRAEGVITQRTSDFVEREYVYASPVFDFNQFLDAMKQIDWDATGANVGWNASRAQGLVRITGPGNEYAAQLRALEDENGEHRLLFCFTSWNTHRGTATNMDSMNRLMTALEKAMLGLDPYVTVRSHLVDVKSKAKFW